MRAGNENDGFGGGATRCDDSGKLRGPMSIGSEFMSPKVLKAGPPGTGSGPCADAMVPPAARRHFDSCTARGLVVSWDEVDLCSSRTKTGDL